jgi:glycosyltransferase involved in cell wall biosynthesis
MVIVQLTTDNREAFREYQKPAPWFGAAPTALLQGFEVQDGVTVHVVSCTQRAMPPPPANIGERIRFHSLRVPKIGWLRTGYQGCIRAVRRLLRELRPDIVHGQGTERDCALSAVFSGFPNVVTIHGIMGQVARACHARPGSFHWLAARLENFVLPRTAGVLCNSAYTEAHIKPRARRTWRVPNPLRLEFFTPRPAPKQSPATVTLVNIGVVCRYKRQLEVLEIVRGLHERGCRILAQFVGFLDPADGYAAEFQRRMREAEERGYARHLGIKSTQEMVKFLDAADAMIHLPAEESFGLVVAEALARNVKLFTVRTGGIPDIVEGVEGVELFSGADRDPIMDAIARWMESGSPRLTKAAEVMRARYHPDVIARRHLEIYHEVLNTRS